MKTDLALQREHLVQRSQLMRVQLRREARVMRESLQWTRAAATVAGTPVVRRIALGMALSLLGAGRAARVIKTVGRVVLAVQLARTLLASARGAGSSFNRRRIVPSASRP
jgi:hypothetical protein